MSYKSLRERSKPLLERAEYHKEGGEIRIAGADWILMRSATFRGLIKGTERILRSGAKVIWLEVGRHAGKEFTQALLREEGIEPHEVPKLLEEFFAEAGWGKIQAKVNFTKKEAVIKIENLATARETKAKEPICQLHQRIHSWNLRHHIRFLNKLCRNKMQGKRRPILRIQGKNRRCPLWKLKS